MFGKTSAVALLAMGLAACSSNSSTTPTSPSTSTGTTAAADGSTLKVSAPAGLQPASGTTIDSRRPTLSWSAATGTNVLASPAYDLQVIVNGATVAEIAVSGTVYSATTDLDPDTTYTWRVRARQDSFVGPWSSSATFTTPKLLIPRSIYPLPFNPPGECGAQANQPTNRSACVRAVAALSSEWAACQRAVKTGCFKFARQVAQALAATDPRWGMVSKNPGDTQCTLDVCGNLRGEGYGEDVIAYLPTHDDTNRWIGFDIITGAGGTSPGFNWVEITTIRPGNRWVPVPY